MGTEKIMLCGSVVLRRLAEALGEARCDSLCVPMSAVSLCSPRWEEITEEDITSAPEKVRMELQKSLPSRLAASDCGYVMVDFYSTAAISLYRRGESYFTAAEQFKRSDFFRRHAQGLELVPQPLEKSLWQNALQTYAKLLRERFGGNIILLRLGFTERCVRGSHLRTTTARSALTRRMREMEDCFIRLADPIVIDVAKLYFSDLDGNGVSSYEEYFYEHVRKILLHITSGGSERLFDRRDPEILLRRVLRYYDSMSARAFWSWLLEGTAADLLIRYTSKQFVAQHKEQLLRLLRCGCTLEEVPRQLAEDPYSADLTAAANALSLLLSGDITKPYTSYSVIFREGLNMLGLMAPLLSARVGRRLSPHDCEAALLLLDKPQQLKKYLDTSPAVTVDIWGSCVCRESVNRAAMRISVDKYIFKQPCLLAFSEPVPCEVPQEAHRFGGSAWRRRTVADALQRNGVGLLQNSSAKWVLVDFYDLISRLSVLDGHHPFECDSFLRRTEFFSSIESRCHDAYLFDIMDEPSCNRELMRFADFLMKRYGGNIILVKAHPNGSLIGLDGRLRDLPDPDGRLAEKRDFIAHFEEIFAQITRCYVVDVSHRFYSDDGFMLGGSHIVHYEEEFYRTCCNHILTILGGTGKRYFNECDERYIMLRDERIKALDSETNR